MSFSIVLFGVNRYHLNAASATTEQDVIAMHMVIGGTGRRQRINEHAYTCACGRKFFVEK